MLGAMTSMTGFTGVAPVSVHHRAIACSLSSSNRTPSRSLVVGSLRSSLAADQHGGLDELVGDGGGQRVAVDDLVERGLLVRRRGQPDEQPRVQVADRR